MGVILHIVDEKAWEAAKEAGSYRPASVDSEGFVHCSTIPQTTRTADTFFRGVHGLQLLCIEESKLEAPCRWEDPAEGPGHSEPGAKFPHIYGSLNLDAVVEVVPFPCREDGTFALPPAASKHER